MAPDVDFGNPQAIWKPTVEKEISHFHLGCF